MARIRRNIFALGAMLAARLAVAQTGDAVAACTEIQSLMSSSGKVMSDICKSKQAALLRSSCTSGQQFAETRLDCHILIFY